ncbi:hypothetical protein TDB9533_01002 [Thalassocella blandensis]|nr:hypothetical protein TDB9533_01002 [Thalassocella blandensis]
MYFATFWLHSECLIIFILTAFLIMFAGFELASNTATTNTATTSGNILAVKHTQTKEITGKCFTVFVV